MSTASLPGNAQDNLAKRLANVKRLFLDTPPIVYLVEKDERYLDRVRLVFERLDRGLLSAVTSCVTPAECLVQPLRKGRMGLVQDFRDLIVHNRNTRFVSLDHEIAEKAAELRAWSIARGSSYEFPRVPTSPEFPRATRRLSARHRL